MQINIDDLIMIIGRKQIEIELLRVQLGNLSGGSNDGNMGPNGAVPRKGTSPKTHEGPDEA